MKRYMWVFLSGLFLAIIIFGWRYTIILRYTTNPFMIRSVERWSVIAAAALGIVCLVGYAWSIVSSLKTKRSDTSQGIPAAGMFVLLILVFLIGYLVTPPGIDLTNSLLGRQDEAEQVTETFLHAIIVNDIADLQETIDPEYYDQVMSTIFLQMSINALVGGVTGEYTELTVNTVSNNRQRAVVHATGKLKISSMGTVMTVPVDIQIPLVRKENKWLVTGR